MDQPVSEDRKRDARDWLLDAKAVVDATEDREDWWGNPELNVDGLVKMYPDFPGEPPVYVEPEPVSGEIDTSRSAGEERRVDKYEHVRRAPNTRDHGCHWPGCPKRCKPAYWGCIEHWRLLPSDIRNEIWRTYAAGQEETMTPSRDYLAAADRAQRWIRAYLEEELAAGRDPRRRSWDDTVRDTRARDRGRTRG